MKKFKLGICAAAFIVGIALSSFTAAPKRVTSLDLYGVTGVSGSSYEVMDITSIPPGHFYDCIGGANPPCTVEADPSNVSGGLVLISNTSDPSSTKGFQYH